MKILVISDNDYLVEKIKTLVSQEVYKPYTFVYKSSSFAKTDDPAQQTDNFSKLNVKNNVQWIIKTFQLVISAHCKQIFPADLVESVRCINIHPGLNPYNRGWYPQVFSILNHLPAGATIHEIDKELDHGPIIAQQQIAIESYDTSLSAYQKIQIAEMDLLSTHLLSILRNEYVAKRTDHEGNLNLKNDFKNLCELDLSNNDTFENHLNKLRALTHGEYKNAFYYDKNSGKKIFVSVDFKI